MKPHNLLIMRNQKVKFGDFGVSILSKVTKNQYKLKGMSREWCMPEIKALYTESAAKIWEYKFTVDQLRKNDIYGMTLAFSAEMIKAFMEEGDKERVGYFGQVGIRLGLERSLTLEDAVYEIDLYLHDNVSLLISYAE